LQAKLINNLLTNAFFNVLGTWGIYCVPKQLVVLPDNIQVEWFVLFIFAVGDFNNGSHLALIDLVHIFTLWNCLRCEVLLRGSAAG
jgi:hypothetical protein